jgi:hypothetical protein
VDPPRGDKPPTSSARECRDFANRCLDMSNSPEHQATRTWWLIMADAWVRAASELDKQR